MWGWLYVRLLVTYDSHSGYDLPFNIFHLIPSYNGAREHDWHHQFFNGMYAPTFTWWDDWFGTNAAFLKHEKQRRMRAAATKASALEARGDETYAGTKGAAACTTACGADGVSDQVPFSTCLITRSGCVVGGRLVAMLAARGAKRIVCMDVAKDPSPDLTAVARKVLSLYGTDVEYIQQDISSEEGIHGFAGHKNPFDGVEVVFHLQLGTQERADSRSSQYVLDAFLAHGTANGKLVFVQSSMASICDVPHGSRINDLDSAQLMAPSERVALQFNGCTSARGITLASCIVSPCQVYAPEDQSFLPPLLDLAQRGALRILGRGDDLTSFTHADNASHGLILAAVKLWREGASSAAGGELFVVTDGGAYSFWDAVDDAVVASGLPSIYPKFRVPYSLFRWCTAHMKVPAGVAAYALRMSFVDRCFCTAKARHVLGYSPIISFEKGWAATVAAASR